ncbi:hypothetical protein HN51_070271 [Arachis hypogaea]
MIYELQQEEELGDELDGEEIFEELTDYDYDDVYGLDSIEDLLKLDFLNIDRFYEARDLMLDLYSSYKALDEGNTPSKPGLGGGTNPKGHSGRKKRQRCSNCKKPGHNKTSCSKHNENAFSTQGSSTRQTDTIYDGECMDNVEYETQEWWRTMGFRYSFVRD